MQLQRQAERPATGLRIGQTTKGLVQLPPVSRVKYQVEIKTQDNCCDYEVSFVVFSLADSCPKETEYCFLEGADPASYDEKRQELCKNPSCQGCFDLCTEVNIFWIKYFCYPSDIF